MQLYSRLTLHSHSEDIAAIAILIDTDTGVDTSISGGRTVDSDISSDTVHTCNLELLGGCPQADPRISAWGQHSPIPIPADGGTGDTRGLTLECDWTIFQSNNRHLVWYGTGYNYTSREKRQNYISIKYIAVYALTVHSEAGLCCSLTNQISSNAHIISHLKGADIGNIKHTGGSSVTVVLVCDGICSVYIDIYHFRHISNTSDPAERWSRYSLSRTAECLISDSFSSDVGR